MKAKAFIQNGFYFDDVPGYYLSYKLIFSSDGTDPILL